MKFSFEISDVGLIWLSLVALLALLVYKDKTGKSVVQIVEDVSDEIKSAVTDDRYQGYADMIRSYDRP